MFKAIKNTHDKRTTDNDILRHQGRAVVVSDRPADCVVKYFFFGLGEWTLSSAAATYCAYLVTLGLVGEDRLF